MKISSQIAKVAHDAAMMTENQLTNWFRDTGAGTPPSNLHDVSVADTPYTTYTYTSTVCVFTALNAELLLGKLLGGEQSLSQGNHFTSFIILMAVLVTRVAQSTPGKRITTCYYRESERIVRISTYST